MATNKRKFAPDDEGMLSHGSDERDKRVKLDTGPAKSKERVTLLTLPGELRNRIYHYMLLVICDRAGYEELTEEDRKRYPLIVRDTRSPPTLARPKYMAATQICRLVRAEFRPLYLAKRRVVVSLEMLDEYLAIFGQDGVGDIVVQDRPLVIGDGGVNIMPLFETNPSGPTVGLEPRPYKRYGPSSERANCPLYSYVRDTEKWIGYLFKYDALEQIRLYTLPSDDVTTRLFLVEYRLKAAFGADWDPENKIRQSIAETYADCCSTWGDGAFKITMRCATWGSESKVPDSTKYDRK